MRRQYVDNVNGKISTSATFYTKCQTNANNWAKRNICVDNREFLNDEKCQQFILNESKMSTMNKT